MGALVALVLFAGLPAKYAAAAIATWLVPERSPIGPAKRLLAKLLPAKE
jgi:hypothetical protein